MAIRDFNLYLANVQAQVLATKNDLADFEQGLALNPFNEEAQLRIGQLMTEQGKLDEAIAYFDELIADEPNFSKAYGERGRVRNLKGDKQGALEDLKKAIELNPNGEEAQRMNGQHTNFNNLYQGGIY